MSCVDVEALESEDVEKALAPLLENLSHRPVEYIECFHNYLSTCLYAMDTSAHYDGAGSPGTDGFLYVRCYAVARGKNFYQKALKDPDKMPGELEWCEELLYMAPKAWAAVTGEEASNFDESFLANSYETGSNPAFDDE